MTADDRSDLGHAEQRCHGGAAEVAGGGDAFTAWREMREREGPKVSLIQLYALVAEPRGLKPHELPLTERRELAVRATPVLWPGFEANLRSEPRRPEPVRVISYDPAWPEIFRAWRERLASLLGPIACRMDHVGSTSVPGLAAKPIVDIQIGVADMADVEHYVPPCEAAGLQLRFRDFEHRYFQPPPGQPGDVHVHVCQHGSDWERLHLLFRDYLRASASAREAYAAAKHEAARLWADQGAAYTEAKSEVILGILNRGEVWADATGWVDVMTEHGEPDMTGLRWRYGRGSGQPDDAGTPAIAVNHLTKDFGGRTAVSDVSFNVDRGEVFGFLGPNGAGKTTTVRTLGTLIAPTSGSATVAGLPLAPENGVEIRRRISIMPESPGLYLRLSVGENLAVFRRPLRVARSARADRAGPARPSSWPTGPATPAAPCPRACASGSPWPGRCSATRRCCSSTSRPPALIRSPPATCTS